MTARPSVPFDAIVPGDRLVPDEHFTCLTAGVPVTVGKDDAGELYVPCSDGRHYLDGQLDMPGGDYVGFEFGAPPPGWRVESQLCVAKLDLDIARASLAAGVAAQKAEQPNRHFDGLPESPWVIEAYDAVRAAEGEVARVEGRGRQ